MMTNSQLVDNLKARVEVLEELADQLELTQILLRMNLLIVSNILEWTHLMPRLTTPLRRRGKPGRNTLPSSY